MVKRTRKTSFFVDNDLKMNADMKSFLNELKQKIRFAITRLQELFHRVVFIYLCINDHRQLQATKAEKNLHSEEEAREIQVAAYRIEKCE